MKEYEEVRHSLIDMLEELDDRLAKITHDSIDPSIQDAEGSLAQTENDEALDNLGQAPSAADIWATVTRPIKK